VEFIWQGALISAALWIAIALLAPVVTASYLLA
jgi:hypothetical protein